MNDDENSVLGCWPRLPPSSKDENSGCCEGMSSRFYFRNFDVGVYLGSPFLIYLPTEMSSRILRFYCLLISVRATLFSLAIIFFEYRIVRSLDNFVPG